MYLVIKCMGSAYVQSVYDTDRLVGIHGGSQDVINLFESGREFMTSNADINNVKCII